MPHPSAAILFSHLFSRPFSPPSPPRAPSPCTEWKKAVKATFSAQAINSINSQLATNSRTANYYSPFTLHDGHKYRVDVKENQSIILNRAYDCTAEYSEMVDEVFQDIQKEMKMRCGGGSGGVCDNCRMTRDKWGAIRVECSSNCCQPGVTSARTLSAAQPANPAIWGFF